jgi:fatty-acyl-CoA synthase
MFNFSSLLPASLLPPPPGSHDTSLPLPTQAEITSVEESLLQVAPTLQFDDPINIQFTSGTTGRPKGATLTHHNILNNGFFVGEGIRMRAGEKVCIPVPLYHCFGMVMGNLACVTHGSTMVYPSSVFDPVATMQVYV